ncbi:N-ATPase subunit AtpR [Yoonia vestfoldensis]|uniref:N-ATPase subunit AtpR n=1 Tax=Yoonia vestfoldensis TaxID=245188 RepID=UPI00039A0A7C|nr:ATP synthase subunit I [Yoonia vestfoldensis]
MTDLPLMVLLPLCFLGGLFIGYGYFRALRETANLLVNGGEPLRAIALTLGRISLLASGFFLAVLAGGLALLAAFAGLLCAKWIMLRRMREGRA